MDGQAKPHRRAPTQRVTRLGARVAPFLVLAAASVLAPPARALKSGQSTPSLAVSAPTAAPSAPAEDSSIRRTGPFDEPLVAVGRTTREEDAALDGALARYTVNARAGARDSVAPLTDFVEAHPASPWRPTLLMRLAAVYRQTGHLSKSLDTWQAAWAATKDLTDPTGRALGDSAAAHLSQFEAYLGRKELLAPLLDELRGRPLQGSAAELVSESSRGLAEMHERPGFSFKCGPYALYRIHMHEHGGRGVDAVSRAISDAKSTPDGLSLPAVRDLSRKIGMNFRMAFRNAGAAVVLPAVVHWRVGHYAALVERVGDDYLVEDSTFGEDIRVSSFTLDEEASGYFLVPQGGLPAGWRAVSDDEGRKVWGRGDTGDNKDNGATGSCGGGGGGGCTSPNVQAMVVGLEMQDTPIGYTPPVGPPVKFGLVYAHRDALQPAVFTYTNFGNKWTTTWLSYIADSYAANGSAMLYGRGGGSETYTFAHPSNDSALGPFTQAFLTRETDADGNTTGFTRRLRDGSVEQFERASGTKYFLTAVVDPHGQQVTIVYDAQMRITSITDALYQTTQLTYGLASDPLKVTSVTDPFGRTATFTYTADGHLASITDVLGITSQYAWGPNDFVTSLTTPYGTTTFSYGDSRTDSRLGTSRFVTITDPLGRTKRVEFVQGAPGINDKDPDATIPAGLGLKNTYLEWRNTFVWSPTQLAAAQGPNGLDYTKARILHWLHTADDSATSRVVENTKEPMENRVWYTYAHQTNSYTMGAGNQPTAVARVLDDGTTQVTQVAYDASGNVTKATDPAGRTYSFTYDADGADLLTVSNTTGGADDLLFTASYNLQHEPVSITDASGGTSTFAYNSRGQTVSATDALGNITKYTYDGRGYLTGIQGPVAGATQAFTYDGAGRVASTTDPAQGTVAFTYDDADRPLTATFPDGTKASVTYHLLELASRTDRLGQTAHLAYDAARELTSVTDAAGNQTVLGYSPSGKLASIQSPNGGTTTFSYDLQDRVAARQFADGTKWTAAYETTSSRVHAITDAMQQTTTYAYNGDNSLAGITYQSAMRPTAAVSFTYDSSYGRLVSMTDGTGTTTYAYNPVASPAEPGAGRLAQVQSPAAGGTAVDTIAYTWDLRGRLVGQNVDGAAATTAYDALGRIKSVVNALDAFQYGYSDGTGRVTSITPSHAPSAAMTYLDPKGGGLLGSITYQGAGGTTLAQLGYAYDAGDRVTSFTQSYPGSPPGMGSMDGGTGALPPFLERLLRSAGPGLPHSAGPSAHARVVEGKGDFLRAVFVSTLVLALGLAFAARASRQAHAWIWLSPLLIAQIVALGCGGGGGGGAREGPSDAGATSEAGHGGAVAATVTTMTTYAYDSADRLVSAISTKGGTRTNHFAYAYDGDSNVTSTVTGTDQTMLTYDAQDRITGPLAATYDADGNPTTLGDTTYQWDAANRLVSVARGTSESDFSYDGWGRMARIVEKQNGAVVADHTYGWCGSTRCVERDNTQSGSPIAKRYFDQGVQIGAMAYTYVKDLLGSVRMLVDANGVVRAQYDYDPYGNPTKISGDLDSDIGYAGYFHHAASGLDLALFRAYSPALQRWLNRDPIGEAGGTNLYLYANANPVNRIDPTGLITWPPWLPPLVDTIISIIGAFVEIGLLELIGPVIAFAEGLEGIAKANDPAEQRKWLQEHGIKPQNCQ
jgi:RHS repeat-associated protein